jgi:hypothetical protein
MHAQVVCSFVVIFLTTSSLLGPADRCYLSSKPSELGGCYFAVTAGAVSISTAVLAGCLTVRHMHGAGCGNMCTWNRAVTAGHIMHVQLPLMLLFLLCLAAGNACVILHIAGQVLLS